MAGVVVEEEEDASNPFLLFNFNLEYIFTAYSLGFTIADAVVAAVPRAWSLRWCVRYAQPH